MKSSISFFLIFLGCFFGQQVCAQIQFVGDPEDISDLNSPEGENFLVISPHGKRMAFTKERDNTDMFEDDYGKKFLTVFDSTWQATVYSDWTNEKGMFSPIGFDADGNQYFSEVAYNQGVYTGKVLKFINGGGAAKVEIPFLVNKSSHQSGYLSKDGQYMLLSMESNYTYGVEDIYLVRKKPDGRWSSPINLGSQINTEYQEITPFLATDNRTLFFATNGRVGQGSFDIYYSIRLDDSWRKWSTPVNLGSSVNTSGAETSFSFYQGEEWAYYVSAQNSDGYGDIRRIRVRVDIDEDTTAAPVEEIPIVADEEVILKFVDKYTRKPVPSEWITEATSSKYLVTTIVVDSLLRLNEEVEIKAKGYLPHLVTLDRTLSLGVNEIELEPVTVGSVITLRHVLFQRGTSNMIEGSKKELDLVVEMMNDNPDMKILLKGHTDNQGDAVVNLRLSEARVKTVREYLISMGVNAYRMRGQGYGGNAPIASNATEETRKLNRRVEFEVIEN